MKKVLFYSPLAWNPHWEVELNLIEEYRRKDYHITLLKCNSELPVCIANPEKLWVTCADCKSRKSAGLKWLGNKNLAVASFYNLTEEQKALVEEAVNPEISSLEQLKAIKVGCSDVGTAALSSVAFVLREANPDVQKYQDLIKKFLRSAVTVHYCMLNHLREKQPDELVTFNGRFAEIRPALQTAWSLNVDTYVHDVAVAGRFWLLKNDFLHGLDVWKKIIKDLFENSDLKAEDKKKIGIGWFEERRNNKTTNFPTFIAQQEKGLLPETFASENINIGIFNSSEDEFVGFDEYKNPLYENQNEALQKILSSFINRPEIKFYLRIHPFLSQVDNSQTRFITELQKRFTNLGVIEPDSPISTYSLLDACDLIITFGSTVGIEAVYAKKPSILIGNAIYEDLKGIIKPKSHAELISVISNFADKNELPESFYREEDFFKYGFFMVEGGTPLKFAKSHDWWTTRMYRDNKEKRIRSAIPINILNKSIRRLRSSTKK